MEKEIRARKRGNNYGEGNEEQCNKVCAIGKILNEDDKEGKRREKAIRNRESD